MVRIAHHGGDGMREEHPKRQENHRGACKQINSGGVDPLIAFVLARKAEEGGLHPVGEHHVEEGRPCIE